MGGKAQTTPQQAITLTVVLHRSKTNQGGTREHLTMYRHKDVRRCPVGAIYLWLHWCFDVTDAGMRSNTEQQPNVEQTNLCM